MPVVIGACVLRAANSIKSSNAYSQSAWIALSCAWNCSARCLSSSNLFRASSSCRFRSMAAAQSAEGLPAAAAVVVEDGPPRCTATNDDNDDEEMQLIYIAAALFLTNARGWALCIFLLSATLLVHLEDDLMAEGLQPPGLKPDWWNSGRIYG